MKQVCFLSTDNLDGYVIDDDLAITPLRQMGYEVESVSWHSPLDWSEFAAVVIRTTWDYHNSPEQFIEVIEEIESKTYLANSLSIVRWNLEKTYLQELAADGVAIVPTVFDVQPIDGKLIEKWKRELGSEKIIVKPTVSATAKNTFLVDSYSTNLNVFNDCAYMVQPFMCGIATEGEYSLFYFDGDFSHAILKTPKLGDFRVQEDFGGRNKAVIPEDALVLFAKGVIEALDSVPVYARVDVVRDESGGFVLMELELIEPALYFRYDKEAPMRFARALQSRINEL